MLHFIENDTIALSLESTKDANYSKLFIHVIEAENAIRPFVLWNERNIQWINEGICWLSVAIGSYFRFILYLYLLKRYKAKELTPINRLTMIVVIVQHLENVTSSIASTMIVAAEDSLDHVTLGHFVCQTRIVVFPFEVFYSCIGSLGVSIYRILLIKHNYFLKDIIGEKIMTKLILFGGIILSALFAILLNSHGYTKLRFDTCMIAPKIPIFELLDEYEQSRGSLPIFSGHVNVGTALGIVSIVSIISEISIYVTFFHHIYKHDNNDRLRRLLEPSVIRCRNKRNAITFFGQFCSFVFELTTMIVLIFTYKFGNRTNNLHVFAATIMRVKFAAMSTIEVMTSNELRPSIYKFNLYNILFGLN